MAVDILGALQASTTVVATTTGSALTIPFGTPVSRPLVARILVSAFSAATGTSTVTFSITGAPDATAYATIATAPALLASATAVATEVLLAFNSPLGFSATSTFKLLATFSGSGVTTPTITYDGYIGLARP